MKKRYSNFYKNKLTKEELNNEGGFIIKEEVINTSLLINKELIKESDYINLDCKFCKNMKINKELYNTFKLNVCNDCKYKQIKLITKTTCKKEFLLTEEELNHFKYLLKPNPNKSTYVDMHLYLFNEIKDFAIKKYNSYENIEKEKEERKINLLKRKKTKMKKRIKDLKRKTIIEKREYEKHKHEFEEINGNLICKCGLVVEQEEL